MGKHFLNAIILQNRQYMFFFKKNNTYRNKFIINAFEAVKEI